MDRINRFLRTACAALCAALMAGCAAFVVVRALGFDVSWLPVYALALASAAVTGLGRGNTIRGIASTVVVIAAFAALLLAGREELQSLLRDFMQTRRLDAQTLADYAAAGRTVALLLALLLGSIFTLLMQASSGISTILLVFLTAVICSFAGNENLTLWMAVPGMTAGVAAFALSVSAGRDGMRPTLMLPAAAVVVLALLLAPGAHTTWAPLEELAARVRAIVEDYVRFTEERVAFTINEKGYNHAELIDDNVIAMLGGPANPSKDSVMRVETDENLLLRGTIKRSYTGYSWVDDSVKARYLYYDFTHRGARSDVFGAETGKDDPGFETVSARVEMLQGGTSTLFVPAVLSDFDMALENAVYYNSAGEIFLTRDVAAGDTYSLETRLPVDDGALVEAARQMLEKNDKQYAEMLSAYTALPEGIDAQVYALAIGLTENCATPAEKALAIQSHLMQNYRYTLDGGYPGLGRDFVSWFLLEEKEGYCSYFASAMTVLCRISGLPARYVEGYFVRAGEDGETIVTGKNAHAWVEVYLNGLGWTPFDPTARAYEYQNGEAGDMHGGSPDGEGQEGESTPFENDDPASGAPDPTPTPTPDVGSNPDPSPSPDLGSDAAGEPTPTPDPDGDDGDGDGQEDDSELPPDTPPQDPPADSPDNPPDTPDERNDNEDSGAWLWILLALLILIALAAIGTMLVRRRLYASDPLKLCTATRSAQLAALILYRGILDLLLQAGFAPSSGETPEAFARRVSQTLPNPAYESFVCAVAESRYSGKVIARESLEAGRRAYAVFLNGMRRSEKLRYHVRRLLHGIGDLENIP